MKRLMLAGGLTVAFATAGFSDGDGLYWVVGNHATNGCDIVRSNPVVDGNIWFVDGPYKSRPDAKLARSTIDACPKDAKDDSADE
jgi:hypothetical protein